MSTKPNVLVLTGFGLNCDHETAYAFELAGATAKRAHINAVIAGDVREHTLEAGQTMKVDPGHIALYDPSVAYDIATVRGLKNVLFSGEGLFLASLKGAG